MKRKGASIRINPQRGEVENRLMTWGEFIDKVNRFGLSKETPIAYIDIQTGFSTEEITCKTRGDGGVMIYKKT